MIKASSRLEVEVMAIQRHARAPQIGTGGFLIAGMLVEGSAYFGDFPSDRHVPHQRSSSIYHNLSFTI